MTLQEPPSRAQDPDELEVRVRVTGKAQIVHVGGELDLSNAHRLDAALAGPGHRRPLVVVDLAGVAFLDSTGLNLLLRAHGRAEAEGRRFVVAGARTPVLRTIELTGLDGVLELVPDAASALDAAA